MSAIPAASVNLKTMADGTLRVSFDIEPSQAQDAFRLFAAPGTPVAIAALKVGYAAKSPEPPPDTAGPLCKWLVLRCKEPEFWAFLSKHFSLHVETEASATSAVKQILQIESRKEVDLTERANQDFHKIVREPYRKWLERGRS